jgi:hypothetical protein
MEVAKMVGAKIKAKRMRPETRSALQESTWEVSMQQKTVVKPLETEMGD